MPFRHRAVLGPWPRTFASWHPQLPREGTLALPPSEVAPCSKRGDIFVEDVFRNKKEVHQPSTPFLGVTDSPE